MVSSGNSGFDGDSRPVSHTASIVASAGLLVLSGLALTESLWRLIAIAWVAYAAMIVGAWLGSQNTRATTARQLVWYYGTASGAMLASACLFLLPPAIGHHSSFGGIGIAAGLIAGFVLHTTGDRITQNAESILDPSILQLTLHSLAAGLIIGTIYSAAPSLEAVMGLAIVSHKGPAGFAVARQLGHRGESAQVIQLPAAAVGLSALCVGIVGVTIPVGLKGLIFGFAAGVFLHVAIEFLPRCRVGGKLDDLEDSRELEDRLDGLRGHAVISTVAGSSSVFALWCVV